MTSGQLTFDFADMSGTIAMTVSHGLIYTIEGDLLIDVVFPSLFADDGTLKATTTSGNCSAGSGCVAFVEGSFFGHLVEGAPAGAGLEYDIQEEGEVIMGVAAFTRVANPPPPGLTLVPEQTLIGIEPNLYTEMDDENAGEGILSDTTVLVGPDSVGTIGMVGSIGTEIDENDLGNDEMYEVLLTIDPNGILGISTPDSAVSVAQGLISDALAGGVGDAAAVNAVIDNPATVAEFRTGTYLGGSYGLGRWTGGNVLFIDKNTQPDSPDFGLTIVEFDALADGLNLHILYGDAANTDFGAGATGIYTFLDASASSDTNGDLIGSGVVDGSLAFDFTTLNGIINMEVLHDTTYMVTGDLRIDPTTPVDFEEGFIIGAAATTDGGPCDDGPCNTLIDGSFFGPPAGTGVNAAPVLAGLDYEIITIPFDPDTLTGKSIIGNAIFKRDGATTPIPDTFTVIPDQGLVLVLPNPNPDPLFPDEFADIGLFSNATNIVGDDRLNRRGLLTTAGFEIDDDTEEEFFVVATIDPVGTLGVIDHGPERGRGTGPDC